MGLEHNADENHLMWSDVDPQIPYDTLDYNIPNIVPEYFLGYEEIQNKIAILTNDLKELDKEVDLLTTKYEQREKPPNQYIVVIHSNMTIFNKL